ncbi:MAG: hypothetical protein SFU86_04930 [Pirellulaceae bacterium]|nr:hypothetical protein [Pirellulaceae bacterium]
MISALVLSVAVSTTMVPPGQEVVNHAHPGHYTQPTVRLFERQAEDRDRQIAWEAYVKQLDQLWLDYRMAGSTPAAFRKYVQAAGQAKRRYVFQDPYLLPIVDE